MEPRKFRSPWFTKKAATMGLEPVREENEDKEENRNRLTAAAPAASLSKEPVVPAPFEASKYQQRKNEKQNANQKLQNAFSTISAPRRLEAPWRPQAQEYQEAQKTIEEHQQKSMRRGTEQLPRAARASQQQSNQGNVLKLGNAAGVKYEKERRTKTVKNGISFSEQQPGWIGWCSDIYPLRAHNKVKPGDLGTLCDLQGIWFHDAGHFHVISKRYPNTVNYVTVYSFGDTGLAERPEEEHDEYLNVIPKDVNEEDFTPQNPNTPNLKIIAKYGKRGMDRKTMVVRVSRVNTRNVDCDELERCGELDPESTKILIAEVLKAQGGEVKEE